MKRRARKKEREAAKAAALEEVCFRARHYICSSRSTGIHLLVQAAGEATSAKRPKIDIPDEDDEDDDDEEEVGGRRDKSLERSESAVDITEKFIYERLVDPRFATELVLVSMGQLPAVLPPHFNNTYTPIAAAGTEGQVSRHQSCRSGQGSCCCCFRSDTSAGCWPLS